MINHLHLKGGMNSNYFITEIEKSNRIIDRYDIDSLFKFLKRYSARILNEETGAPKFYFRKQDALAFRYGSIPSEPTLTSAGKLSVCHSNIESTDALILDIDHFADNVTITDVSSIIEVWLGHSTKYIWWATPSSRIFSPRVRVVVALSRNVTKEEYYDLKFRIPKTPESITGLDDASFRLGQFFIIPCIISDTGAYSKEEIESGSVPFAYEMHDGKPLNVDKLPKAPVKSRLEYHTMQLEASESVLREVIESCIRVINEAPSGEGYETTKTEVARMFAKYKIPLEYIEDMSSMIESPKRRKHFEGISKWISEKR